MRILYNFQKLINEPEHFTKEKYDKLRRLFKAYLPDIYHRNDSSAFQWLIIDTNGDCLVDYWYYNGSDAKRGTRNFECGDYDSEFTFDDSKIIIMSLF